ncbi:MAG TPA: hypothetical protein VFO28_12990 [Burkholderiaceae bacterium]|nr:hypothetical protein [Burkholderiaceae bacterium]
MADLWPWLAMAGLGALHGLSPANGWMFAAACGLRAGCSAQARRALLPIAVGHAASVAVVATVAVHGLAMDRALFQSLAGALLVAAASYRLVRSAEPWAPGRAMRRARPTTTGMATTASHVAIALWSFLMATAHGAGLMLVPALVPLCVSGGPARELSASASWLLALAAVAVHTAAMLLTTGAIATGVCRGVALQPRLLNGTAARQVWTAALAVTGLVLMAWR